MNKQDIAMLEIDDFVNDLLESSNKDAGYIEYMESFRCNLKKVQLQILNGEEVTPFGDPNNVFWWVEAPYNPENELDYIISMAGSMGGIGSVGIPNCDSAFGKELIIIEECSSDTIADIKALKAEVLRDLGDISLDWHTKFNKCNIYDKDFREYLLKCYKRETETFRGEDGIRYVVEDLRMKFQHKFLSFVDDYIRILTYDKWLRKYDCKGTKTPTRFFETKLSDEKLLAIRDILIDCKGGKFGKDRKYLASTNDNDWLCIFGRRKVEKLICLEWLQEPLYLISTFQKICGIGTTLKPLLKEHFGLSNLPQADISALHTPLKTKLEEIIDID